MNGRNLVGPDKLVHCCAYENISFLHTWIGRNRSGFLTTKFDYAESVFSFFAPRPYQIPDVISTAAHAPVKKIRNGEGSMNQATTAAAADIPPQR